MRSVSLIGLLVIPFLNSTAIGAGELTFLGPQDFLREEGKPYIITETFLGIDGVAILEVVNGNSNGDDRVSAAIISVNGAEVLGTNDFDETVDQLAMELPIFEGLNRMTVELRSKPGSHLSIEIFQEVMETAAAIAGVEGVTLTVPNIASNRDGLTLEIPPGAVDEPTIVSVEILEDGGTPDGLGGVASASGAAFRLKPEGIQLLAPATIRVPVLDSDHDGRVDGTTLPARNGSLFYLNEAVGEWVRVETTFDPTTQSLVAQTLHFSSWDDVYWRWEWRDTYINYGVEDVPDSIYYPADGFRLEIHEALKEWEKAVALGMRFVGSSLPPDFEDAQFLIRTEDLCTPDWGGPSSENCHADAVSSIPVAPDKPSWIVTFNSNASSDLEPLWVTGSYGIGEYPPALGETYLYRPFLRTALHEFGHVMGLNDHPSTNTPTNEGKVVMGYDDEFYVEGDFQSFNQPLTVLDSQDVSDARGHYFLPADGTCPCQEVTQELLALKTYAESQDGTFVDCVYYEHSFGENSYAGFNFRIGFEEEIEQDLRDLDAIGYLDVSYRSENLLTYCNASYAVIAYPPPDWDLILEGYPRVILDGNDIEACRTFLKEEFVPQFPGTCEVRIDP